MVSRVKLVFSQKLTNRFDCIAFGLFSGMWTVKGLHLSSQLDPDP